MGFESVLRTTKFGRRASYSFTEVGTYHSTDSRTFLDMSLFHSRARSSTGTKDHLVVADVRSVRGHAKTSCGTTQLESLLCENAGRNSGWLSGDCSNAI